MSAMSPNSIGNGLAGLHSGSISPRTVVAPKTIQFVLVLPNSPYQARLPLRVSIYLHDTTDSIITTVKNFYGLYSGPSISKGVSFEDEDGNTLIARYENFKDNMIVRVRVIDEPLGPDYHAALGGTPSYYHAGAYQSHIPHQPDSHAPRPASRTSRVRSPSPNSGRGRRSASTGAGNGASKKGRSRSSKNRTQTNGESHTESVNGYSSGGDGANSSFSRSKEQIGNTEISVENIVEGGRRKRTKFESSELPLFAPPQMPASTSNPSVSPARRVDAHRGPPPFITSTQNPFSHPRPLHSPRTFMNGYAQSGMFATPSNDNRRSRGSYGSFPGQGDNEVMPTPEPTVRSAVSEEDKDVAMQLMRMSTHGRASGSGQDDALSGKADAASSAGATSDAESSGEEEVPASRRQKLDASGNHRSVFNTTESHFVAPRESTEASVDDTYSSDSGENGEMGIPLVKGAKLKANTLVGPKLPHKTKSSAKLTKPKVKKPVSTAPGPMTPASLPASRKQSISSIPTFPLGPGEEEQPDLSTKPRCQRCRKSKKGCDRQRPCGRCRDAGLPAELCISEDEGNGRKGRYGRHMGVPIKKEEMPPPPTNLLPAAPIAPDMLALAMASPGLLDKNKKRKR